MVVLQDGDWPALLGDTLLETGGGEVGTAAALVEKEAVALLFSARWCANSCSFTRFLATSYASSLERKGLAVVFVSKDHSQPDFTAHFGEMPWLAVPFRDRPRERELSRRFGVTGLPALVVLDAEGAVISKDGHGLVTGDPAGNRFPWRSGGQRPARSDTEDMELDAAQTSRHLALGFCAPAACCWWIPVLFFVAAANFADTCERDIETWMKAFSLALLLVAPATHCIVVLCAKSRWRWGYNLGVKLHCISGVVLSMYCLYGVYLYEESSDVMCYDGSGPNPMVIMRVLWILVIICLAVGLGTLGCICCSSGAEQTAVCLKTSGDDG